MSDGSSTAKSIFLNALEISSAEARQAYISAQCGGDESLGGEVEALLRQHRELGSFLEAPAANEVTALGVSTLSEGAGNVVGPYKLLQQIGEGGMGVVFMAEQQRPVQRMVALKIIKPGMDTRQVIARFEAERQALALMDHPHIAEVLDAGATETGRPYFVMELVKGVPITEYCDEHHLTPRERLDLFVPVCQAVQHAHQKGIIHRDLKPSNVMIALFDGRPVPKVIDFGVAKATGRKLTERTMFTEYGAVIGTVEYMSPEQAELNQLDIDTRSDIYSLGVLLYELLTSMTPFDKGRLRSAAFMEMLRIIREEDPPKPSTRLSTIKELATIAADRGLEPKKLSGAMRGDLDWIVMKCLDKDRNRRYETANGVAMDVQRFLDGEAVLAVPPSATYRLRKFVRKNRAMLATTAAIVALLIGGIAVSTWQAIRATRAESVAVENETKAEQERQIAEAVRKFLDVDLLSQADPGAQADALISAGGRSEDSKQNPTIRELLDRAASELATDRIEKHFPNQPLVQAEILRTVGGTYMELGEYPQAIEMLKRSTELFQRFRGVDHPRTLSSMGELALAYMHAEAIDLALPLAEQTLRLWKAKPDRNESEMIRVMGYLGDIYSNQGLREKSVEITEAAYQLAKTTLGSNNEETLIMMRELAKIYSRADRNDLATPLMEQALQLEIANLGSDHVVTLMGMYSLAHLYEQSGKLELALPLSEETVRLSAAKLGADHPHTLIFKSDLGYLYRITGKLDKSMTILEETFQIMKRKLGPNHTYTLQAMSNLAATYRDAGKLELGLPLQEETFQIMKRKLGPNHPYTLQAMSNLAATYRDAGKPELGLPLQEEVLRLQRSKQGGHAHPDTSVVRDQLAILEEEVTRKKEKLGPSDKQTLLSIGNLAAVYMQQGKTELAVSSYEELVKLTKAKLGPENTETVGWMERLAEVYLGTAARQAWLTEHKKWEETCQTAIRFAEGANNPVILERAAKACSLSPTEDSEQRATALVLARKAVELGKKHQWLPFFQLTLGMAEYRSGHYQEADAALDSASKSVKRKGQLDNIAAFYHAMSLFHQGKQDEARKIAASAAAKMKPLPHDEKTPQPHDDLIEWLAYKEAQAMMP